jgi:hypothetical protein
MQYNIIYLYFLTTEKIIFYLQIFDFTIKSTVRLRNFATHRLAILGLSSNRDETDKRSKRHGLASCVHLVNLRATKT